MKFLFLVTVVIFSREWGWWIQFRDGTSQDHFSKV